jgi:integrase/recombinase XerD
LQAVLDAPDPTTHDGIRDRAMLHLAVCAGLRVSELTGLKIDDIDLPSMSIRVLGKGRRERTLPLVEDHGRRPARLARRSRSGRSARGVRQRSGRAAEPMGLRLSAQAARRDRRSIAARPDKKRVSPHVLRHTCAMIVLQATQDIRKVSLWLGHATLTTTEVYTRGDPTEKLDAMESIVPPHLRRGAFQPSDKLIALLKRPS